MNEALQAAVERLSARAKDAYGYPTLLADIDIVLDALREAQTQRHGWSEVLEPEVARLAATLEQMKEQYGGYLDRAEKAEAKVREQAEALAVAYDTTRQRTEHLRKAEAALAAERAHRELLAKALRLARTKMADYAPMMWADDIAQMDEALRPAASCRVCATKAAGLPTPGYTHDPGCPAAPECHCTGDGHKADCALWVSLAAPQETREQQIVRCRTTPGKCFCGVHISDVMAAAPVIHEAKCAASPNGLTGEPDAPCDCKPAAPQESAPKASEEPKKSYVIDLGEIAKREESGLKWETLEEAREGWKRP